ncbi:MAG TPA: DUF169 domain-containing protein [Bryobacteraceae bacterium]|nr:DUF169 domain-containing protein [Bryobacteraceae bacterium]
MTPFDSIARALSGALDLVQPPVAISFRDSVPGGVKIHPGPIPAGCGFWQEAATDVFATTAREHELCSIGMYTHHLEQSAAAQTDLQDSLKVFGELGYVRPEDLPLIPVLKQQAKVVVYGPLASIPVTPDVVLLFVRAAQMLILSEASQQLENGWAPALGRPACGIVPQAFNTGRTALSLGCCGARAYLDVLTPDMALYAVPGSRLGEFTDRVAALAKANSTLISFHKTRRKAVEAGERPTIKESLAAM